MFRGSCHCLVARIDKYPGLTISKWCEPALRTFGGGQRRVNGRAVTRLDAPGKWGDILD